VSARDGGFGNHLYRPRTCHVHNSPILTLLRRPGPGHHGEDVGTELENVSFRRKTLLFELRSVPRAPRSGSRVVVWCPMSRGIPFFSDIKLARRIELVCHVSTIGDEEKPQPAQRLEGNIAVE